MRAGSKQSLFAVALAAAVMLSGCAHLGPETVAVDRLDYSRSIADSWKQQTLLNIVKLRYLDLPVFLDVSSIVAGYSLQSGVTVNGTLSSKAAVQGNFAAAGGQAIFTDRPTITYSPMTGEKFLRGLITPIEPKNIFSMIQAGYAADFLLALTVESLNGVHNRSSIGGVVREADPNFVRALQLLRDAQAAGAVGMRIEVDKMKNQSVVLFFRKEGMSDEMVKKTVELRTLLGLPAGQQTFTLVYSPMRGLDNELTVDSRSMLQIMSAFATYVEVPEAHIMEHRATPTVGKSAVENQGAGVRIRSGKQRPQDAFASVHYHDCWFWIDDRDWQTKRALTAVMFFFTLADTAGNEKAPVITIPAQ